MFRFFEDLIDPYEDYPQTDKPPRQVWPFMRDYLASFKGVFAATTLVAIVIAAVEIGLIAYVGRVVNILAEGSPETVWGDHGTELILAALAILFLRPVIEAIGTFLLNNSLIPNVGTLFRWRAHNHVVRQSVGWFENDFAGRIANRVMQAPPAAGEVVYQVFDAMAYATAYFLGALILLNDADPRLMIPLLVWFALYAVLMRWTVKRVGPASKAASDARSALTGRIVDTYTNIHSVKIFSHNARETEYVKEAIDGTRNTVITEMRIFSRLDICLSVLNSLLLVGVIGWAIALWFSGSATVGTVAAAGALTMRLSGMIHWIMWALVSFFRELGVVEEGLETISQPIALVDQRDAKDLDFSVGQIDVKGLSHHYGRSSGGLDTVSLTVRPGEKIGLVGRSGAGKTTLVKLLLRFYDPESGVIEVDGQDITAVTQASLRRQIGMVQQDSSLLHRSVRENIAYGRPDATEEQIIAAAKQAEAHEFILDLADNDGNAAYDALVGERGVKLSGGQRQRIALARVILKNAPILLLDEATSALDSEVEASIQATLATMMEGKTVIAIAHRLSTIAAMDRILVMDEGRIVEEGTHDALLAQEGLYAMFWRRQSGGMIRTEAAE